MGGEWDFEVNADRIPEYQKMLLEFESHLDKLRVLFGVRPHEVTTDMENNVFLRFHGGIDRYGSLTDVIFPWDPTEDIPEVYPHLKRTPRNIQMICLTFQQILHLKGLAKLDLNPSCYPYMPTLNYIGSNDWEVCKNVCEDDFIPKLFKIFEYFKIIGYNLKDCNCVGGGICTDSDCKCHKSMMTVRSCDIEGHAKNSRGFCDECSGLQKYCGGCSECTNQCRAVCGQ